MIEDNKFNDPFGKSGPKAITLVIGKGITNMRTRPLFEKNQLKEMILTEELYKK